MEFISNPYAMILLVSGLIVGVISASIGFQFKDSLRWIGFTMFSIAVWGFFYGIELLHTEVRDMLFWTKIEYLGLLSAPACWMIFSMKYTSVDSNKVRLITKGLLSFALISYGLVATNSWHHLHYKSYWLIDSGPIPLLGIENGIWYYVQTAYAYICFFLGTLILWKRFRFANVHFRILTRLLIIGGFFPLLLNLLYQTSILKPFNGLDLTPFAFLFSYLFVGIAIVRFKLLDLKPIVRDKILEMFSQGVLVLDPKKKIVDFNPAVKSLFSNSELVRIGQSAEELFKTRPKILEFYVESYDNKSESKLELDDIKPFLKLELVPLLDKKNQISGHLLLIENITQEIETNEKLKQQAVELQQLNNLKDKFFSIISHDLKGPIFGVKELIHLTQSGLISHEEFLEILPEVSRNMEQVANLLENLLAWTSSQLRGEHIVKKELELTTILRSQKNLLQRIAKEKNISIELENLEETWVEADKNMLELVIRNLISNAIKFSPPHQKVEVSLSKNEKEVTVCVRDFGVGIEEENLTKLNSGTSFTTRGQNNESGTGLGLILAREYIFKNGGKLTINSKVGEGSKFCFTLPLVETHPGVN